MRDWRYREEESVPDPANDAWGLLRGCLARAIGWSVLAGVALAPSYVLLAGLLFIAPGQPAILVSGWLWGFMLLSLMPGVAGGFVIGILTGVVLAAVLLLDARLGYPARRFHVALSVPAATAAPIIYWGLRHVLEGYRLPLWEPRDIPIAYIVTAIAHFILQLAGVGVAGWWIGGRVARWYRSEIFGRERE